MDSDKITILNEVFEKGQAGEKVQGITIIMDGKIKEIADVFIMGNPEYKDYNGFIKEALFMGIDLMIKNHMNGR